jgi:GTP cyclohydrolase I
MSRFDALLDACHKRARPIIMTTIAMGAGMLPIAVGLGSADPSFRSPMSIAVIGGLIHVDGAEPAGGAGGVHLRRRRRAIHMSRLYRLLCDSAESERLGTASLEKLLRAMVGSHADCGSARARLVLSFELLCKRPALVTPGLHGWNAYPVRLEAAWRDGRFTLDAQVRVTYASTCPCSAALSRQLVADAFDARFAAHATVATADALAWLQDHATLATPHSQRSIADIQVRLPAGPPDLGLLRLIDQAEAALGTPVQAAVKRADEQAFARLNGQNLMYVEDAARKLQAALAGSFAVTRIDVRHLESLHPHDAFARVSNAFAGEVRP